MEDKIDHPLGEKELLLRKWTVLGNCGVYVINISHRWKKPLNLGDIYDALITDRPYRDGMPLEKAVEIIKQEANNEKLDKVVVGHLIEVVSGDPRGDATQFDIAI